MHLHYLLKNRKILKIATFMTDNVISFTVIVVGKVMNNFKVSCNWIVNFF